jgi:hypothetical protein
VNPFIFQLAIHFRATAAGSGECCMKQTIKSQNGTFHSFCRQLDVRKSRDRFGTQSAAVIQPKNAAAAREFRRGDAPDKAAVDFLEKDGLVDCGGNRAGGVVRQVLFVALMVVEILKKPPAPLLAARDALK